MSSYEAPHLYDIIDADEIAWLSANGYVREQQHPTEPLAILNYTDRAQVKPEIFAQVPSLNECRGLIWNTDNGQVVARPFPKFWNYGQAGAAEIPLYAPVVVTDKVDGSLGILYREPSTGYPAIATRGSFASDQAKHATKLVRTKYGEWAERKSALGETLLFEIVYPENRIVLSYGQDDDLFLLGARSISHGYVVSPEASARAHGWKGPRAKTFVYTMLAEALAAEPRENAEGMVVRWPHLDGDRMVKIKQEDYVALHRIVTGLNERTVWEHLKADKDIDELIEPLPDEFHLWVRAVAMRLQREINVIRHHIEQDYSLIGGWEDAYADPKNREARREFAQLAKGTKYPWAMFALLDDKPIRPKLWELVKPEPGKNPSNTPLEA